MKTLPYTHHFKDSHNLKTVCSVIEDIQVHYEDIMQQPTQESGSCTRSAQEPAWESGWFSQDARRAETRNTIGRKPQNQSTICHPQSLDTVVLLYENFVATIFNTIQKYFVDPLKRKLSCPPSVLKHTQIT